MGMLGAMAGLGKGVSGEADRRLKMYDAEKLMALKKQAEMEKEQRIAEIRRGDMAIQNQYNIDAENRGMINSKKSREEAFAFDTDPENVQKKVEAELLGERAKDEYRDSRYDKETQQAAGRAKAIADATDKTDYTARELDREIKRLQLTAHKEGNKLPESVKETIKSLDKDIKNEYDMLKMGNMSLEAEDAAKARIQDLVQEKRLLLMRNLPDQDKQYFEQKEKEKLDQDRAIADLLLGSNNKEDNRKPASGMISEKKKKDSPSYITSSDPNEILDSLRYYEKLSKEDEINLQKASSQGNDSVIKQILKIRDRIVNLGY